MKMSKDQYDAMFNKFERIPTMKVRVLEACTNCELSGEMHNLCIPNHFKFRSGLPKKGIFCFQVCDKCYEIKVDIDEFKNYVSIIEFNDFINECLA